MLKLNLCSLPVHLKSNPVRPKRPAWYKSTEEQTNRYTNTLNEKLAAVPVPDCLDMDCVSQAHSNARDGFVLHMLRAVTKSSHATIPMVGGGQGRGKPDSGCVLGWREEVAPQQKTAVFWHSVWMSAGRPNTGQLFEIVKRTRNQFPYACRRVRKEAYTIKSQKLFEASLWGGADLFDELKKTREAGTDRISQRMMLEPMGRRKSPRNSGKFIVVSIT